MKFTIDTERWRIVKWMEKTIELQKRIEGGHDESKQCTE